MSEVPVATCPNQSSTIIYCFISGTHSYIDGTKDWKTMKKRLRFQMPHVPLKVLRGEEDRVDTEDENYERFQAPGTATEDDEDDSRTSSLSDERPNDTDEFNAEGMVRYLGNSIDNLNHEPRMKNTPEYNTTGSVNCEAHELQVLAQVNHRPDSDVTCSEDATPLLTYRQSELY